MQRVSFGPLLIACSTKDSRYPAAAEGPVRGSSLQTVECLLMAAGGPMPVSTLVSNPAPPRRTQQHLTRPRLRATGCFRCSWVLQGAGGAENPRVGSSILSLATISIRNLR